ncbi:hypothetical protein PG993_015233 [Apiospora rasikravindrae]|uniref:Heterokaryon incompatibility domain-containing protein n=1 Tax=Apiospora rasikravindrae TaxID=990691 RepID=A0ABR1RR68_9PEZI
MDSNSYPYNPLRDDEIRYLVIHAFNESIGVVQCTLCVAPLHDLDNSFTALSYVWGNVNTTDTIQLTGHPFNVTTNLRDCLRQFAINSKYRTMKLWVDAVCINQQDTYERNAQVQRMGDIYSSAESVIAWLGPGTHLSRIGMQRLQNISLDEVKSRDASTGQDVVTRRNHIWSEVLAGDGEQGLRDIILRPYWHRTWIVQEILLGKRVRLVCGDDEVPLEWMQALQRFLARSTPGNIFSTAREEHQQAIIQLATDSAIGCMEIALTDTVQDILLDRLSTFASFQCSDDRDKVYALLGPCRDAQHIVPNYERPTAKVYGDVVEAHIKAHDNLYFLNHVKYHSEENRSCASWVPNWNGPRAYRVKALLDYPEKVFQASKKRALSTCPWSLDRDTESLHLTGACLDTITDLSTQVHTDRFSDNEVNAVALDCLCWFYKALTQEPLQTMLQLEGGIGFMQFRDKTYPLNDDEPLEFACRRTLVASFALPDAQAPFMMLFQGEKDSCGWGSRQIGSVYAACHCTAEGWRSPRTVGSVWSTVHQKSETTWPS